MAQDWRSRAIPVQETGTEEKKPSWRDRAIPSRVEATGSDWRSRAVAPTDGEVQPAVAQVAAVTPSEEKQEALKPTGFEGSLNDADFQAIGKKYNIDPEELRSIAPYFDAVTEPRGLSEIPERVVKYGAGFLGSVAGGIPQFIYKKMQSPNMRKAIDELNEIGYNQKNVIGMASEMVAGPPILKAAKSVPGRLASAAATGAVFGTAGSKEGQEIRGATLGAGIGLGLGGAAETATKVLSKWKVPPQEADIILKSKQNQMDIENEIQKVSKETTQSDQILEDLVVKKKESLSPEEMDTLLKENLSEAKLQKYLDPDTLEHSTIVKQLRTNDERAIKSALANNIVTERTRDLAEDIIGKRPQSYAKAITELDDIYSRQGPEALQNRYRQFAEYKKAEEAIRRAGLLATDTPTAIGKAANFLSDNQFVFRNLDQKYGTKLEANLRDLNSAYNRSTYAQKEFREKLGETFRVAKKAGADDAVVNTTRVYDALDTGNLVGLSQAEKTAADAFKKYFSEAIYFVNKRVKESDPNIARMSIPQMENYVPKYMKSVDEMLPALQNKIKEAEESLGVGLSSLSSGDLAIEASKNNSVKELIQAVQLLDNKSGRILSYPQIGPSEAIEKYMTRVTDWQKEFVKQFPQGGVDLVRELRQMAETRGGNIALETKAGSALERTDAIPDFMLEKNLYKLAKKYADTTMKHLYLRKDIDRLRYQAKMLDKVGADVESKYVKNLIADIMGVRSGTFAEATMQMRIGLNKKLDEEIKKAGGKATFKGGALTAAKAIPEWLEEMTRQIYPNVLGYGAIRPVIQNMTQLLTKTAPELGSKYGYATLLRTLGSVIVNKDLPRLVQKARSLGTVPAEFTREGERAIAEGIRRSSLYAIPADALAGMAKFGMKLFSKAEELNRALVIGVGETMAKDLAVNSKWARQALSKMPQSLQKELQRNPEAAIDLIPKYLNDSTMYNYNRVSMSEYGRTMGPLFSAFSKWPTATLGEVLNEMKDKGVMRGMGRNWEKFITPLLLLQGIDYIAGERIGEKDSLTDIQKKLMGSYGISQSAPAGSIGGILKGEIFTPPAVDAVVQTISPIMEGDVPKVGKGAGAAVMNFTPGAGIMRLLFDDLVTYFTGERPEGDNPTSRVVEGIRRTTN